MKTCPPKKNKYTWVKIIFYILFVLIFVAIWFISINKAHSYEKKLLDESSAISSELSQNFSEKITNIDMNALNLGLLGETLVKKGFTQYGIIALEKATTLGSYRDLNLYTATVYFNLGNYDKALEKALAAKDIDPIYAPTYELLAQIYTSLGDTQNAEICYNKSKEFKGEK